MILVETAPCSKKKKLKRVKESWRWDRWILKKKWKDIESIENNSRFRWKNRLDPTSDTLLGYEGVEKVEGDLNEFLIILTLFYDY